MGSWSIVDKAAQPEEFTGFVYHNEGKSNFAVRIANILSSSIETSNPTFQHEIRLPYICIYFENLVLFFNDNKCSNIKLFKAYDSNIAGVVILKDSDKLLVVQQDGYLVLTDIEAGSHIKSSSSISDQKFIHVDILEEDSNSFIVTSNSLTYHRLKLFLNEEIEDITFDFQRIKYSELPDAIVYGVEILENSLKTVHSSAFCMKSSDDEILAVCPITNQQIALTDCISGKLMQTFFNTDRFLFLNESTELCIANSFSFNIEFNIPVSKSCYVVAAVDDSAVYLDVVNGKVYIYQIQENSPMSQLEILIASRNYEGAEAFAKQNNLSPEAVLELKAKCLLNKLKKVYSAEALQELQDILNSCENVNFIISCCLEGIEASINLFELLNIARKHLDTLSNKDLKERILELTWKTEVYRLFEMEEMEDQMDWETFSKLSGLNLLTKLLNDDQLDRACIVWQKCCPYLIHSLTQLNIVDLLYSVPSDSKLNGVLRWLECLVTNIINIRPYSADIIIKWAQERILLLENSKHWPEVGIQLAEKLIPLVFETKVTLSFVPIETEKFYFLLHSLKHIQTLRKSYNIIVSLKDFMSLSYEALAKLILRKAFAEDLDSLIRDYLNSYETRHNINIDNLIRDHITEVVSSSSGVDEKKMQILLGFIHNIEDRLKCIIMILKAAQIPLTETMYNIARSGVQSQHPLAKNIHTELIHGELRGILMKYKCHTLSFEDYDYLIKLIIRKGDPEMLSDVEKVTNVYHSLHNDAYLMCIQNYLQKSLVNLALKLFNKMGEEFKKMCIEFILLKLENLLCSNLVNDGLECNYLDFLNSLYLGDNIATYQILHNMFILKNKYNFKLSINEYSVMDRRRTAFVKWCKGKIENDLNEENVKQILILVTRVGSYLELSKTDTILILLSELPQKTFHSIAALLFDSNVNILHHDIGSIDIIIKLLPYVDFGNSSNIFIVLKHILKVIQCCDHMNLPSKYLNVMSWILNICYSHNSSKEVLSSWNGAGFYNPHVITPMTPIWNEMISKTSKNDFREESLCFCQKDPCMDGSLCLPQLLSKLQLQQNDLHFSRISALYVIKNLKNNIPLPSWFVHLNESMVKTLASKMLTLENPDNLNVSVLLFTLSSPIDWLYDLLSGYSDSQRRINIAQYILRCKEMFRFLNIPYKEAFDLFSQNNISAKLEKYGISLKDFHMENNTCNFNINSLLESLVNIESFNILTLEEFCLVTGISLDQALTFYLFSILKTWNTNYEISEDALGSKVVIKPTNDNIPQQSIAIINKIKGKKELVENLTTLFKHGEINFQNLTTISLNQYCYEVFLFILDLLKHITGEQLFYKEYLMLKFLQTYQRTNKPMETELDIYSVKETFPKIGYYRLPFQPLITPECWTYLKTELTLDTYERWLSVAGLLTLDVGTQERYDMIRSSAVRGSMAAMKSVVETSSTKWSLHLQNEDLLKKAHRCIQNISHLEWAGACFYLVYQGCGSGADQVTAARMCYQFAEHSSKIQPNNILKKMQSKYLIASTAHILYKVGLADAKLLALCENPQKLIEALFNHKCILTYTECPNMNNAVDEIAKLNDLDISSIRINILEKILSQSNVHGKSVNDDGTLNKEIVVRACYILKGTNPMMAATYLSIIALQESGSLDNYNKKIRALQCLLSLVDNDVVETVTQLTVINLWFKLWEMYCINSLCSVGLEFLTSIFLENKEQALAQIWNAREHNQSTIMLVLKIVFIYNVQLENTMMDQLIKRMLKLGMYNEIRDFLFVTKPFYTNSYVEAWSNVLLNPFKRLDNPITTNQKESCYETLKLLPVCSVTSSIDLTSIWYNTMKLGANDMSATVLPHVSPDIRKKIVMKMGKIQPSFLQDIKSLKSKGIVMADIILASLKSAYKKK